MAKRINAAVIKERILKTENLEVRKRGGQLLREDEVILYVVKGGPRRPKRCLGNNLKVMHYA